jgi:hypothetical protein
MNQYLQTLGLEPGVSEADIKKAYRKLAKVYHPDVSQDPDAQRKFVEITEAYNFLMEVGATPHHERVSYDYDPLVKEYEERRKKARAYAREKRRKAAEEKFRALYLIYTYTDYMVGAVFLINTLLFVDYLLPATSQTERIRKLEYSYESPSQQRQNLIYRHGTIYFDEHSILVDREITDMWHFIQPQAVVYTSPILDTVLKAEVVLRGETLELRPVFSVYQFFLFLIPAAMLLAVLYFRWPKVSENKIGLVVILFILFVIQLLVYLLSS